MDIQVGSNNNYSNLQNNVASVQSRPMADANRSNSPTNRSIDFNNNANAPQSPASPDQYRGTKIDISA